MSEDFPTVLGNRMAANPAGYLQAYVRGIREYKQTGTNIPSYRVQDKYAQESGQPLLRKKEISTPRLEPIQFV